MKANCACFTLVEFSLNHVFMAAEPN